MGGGKGNPNPSGQADLTEAAAAKTQKQAAARLCDSSRLFDGCGTRNRVAALAIKLEDYSTISPFPYSPRSTVNPAKPPSSATLACNSKSPR